MNSRLTILFILLAIVIPLPAIAQTPPLVPPQPEASSPQLGFHIGQGDAAHLQAVRRAGGRFAVVVFSWANIEPEPNYIYWETADAALRAAEFYGIDLIARLDQPPAWAAKQEAGAGQAPWQVEAYANFARRVAERYGDRLAGVIIWNEPNLSLEWNNRSPNAAAYVEMLKAAYPAVKSAAPELPVLLAGLASTEGEGDWAINDLDYLQALYAAGAKDYFDILTAHPYGFGRPPDDAPEKFRPNFRRLELYRNIMLTSGDEAKPVWVTEMGWLVWTDNPKHEWQVVAPEVQADYTLQAIDYARHNYPWLERLGLWALNRAGDSYGYGIWQGPDQSSPTYDALVAACASYSPLCQTDPAHPPATPEVSSPTLESSMTNYPLPITILSPDVAIRLGDRGDLHPHWVHLHEGGQNFSPEWQGEFFLSAAQAGQVYDLLLETMQVDQSANRLFINGREIASLHARPRPDPTSSWVTQRFSVPAEILQGGLNTLSLMIGPRNPGRQYMAGRWENMQFRHIRLVPAETPPQAILIGWELQPSPNGWSETGRLRPGQANDVWLTGIRPGQVWRVTPDSGAEKRASLKNEAGNRGDLIFNDILPTPQGELVATQQGLFWRTPDQAGWQPITGPPDGHAYVVAQANNHFYAGFEKEGLWQANMLLGPWQQSPLSLTTVIDLAVIELSATEAITASQRLYASTATELFVNEGGAGWNSVPLSALSKEEMAEAGESPGDKFKLRLYATSDGRLVVRNQDRLWLQSEQEAKGWTLFGPEKLQGKLFSLLNCCMAGALIGTNKAGLWQFTSTGAWQRLDDGFFDTTDITELFQREGSYYAAGDLGLFQSQDGRSWQKAAGLPPTVTDLLIDPTEPKRWLAGTPAGLYRSQDGGQSWESVSPPWTVWDIAIGPQGRFFVGRSNGLAWMDDLSGHPIQWQTGDGMERVYFLRINPHPVEAQLVWAGTWGNNIGASNDGGQNFEPIHHGLETLSGLDLIWHPTPGQVTLATFEGLYRTDDSGQSWFRLPGPLSGQTIYSLLQSDDGAIWAGAADGLWVSRDYGQTWERKDNLPQTTILRLGRLILPPPSPPVIPPFSPQPHQARVYAPREWFWAGTEGAGLWLSQDGGDTWHFAGLPGRTIYNLFFDPLRTRRLVAATDEGIFAVAVFN